MIIPHKIFTQKEAKKLAENLSVNDDWNYIAENNPNPNGAKTAIIRIYDEYGEFVGNL